MNKVIVTTTINPPTEATIAFSQMKDWTLVVAGDAKTPDDRYKDLNCVFVSYGDQYSYDRELSDLIGPNCIQRRNFGFLWAIKELKADIVATVDDDNMPLPGWGEEVFVGKPTLAYPINLGDNLVFDPLSVTNYGWLWHRGFPVQLKSSPSCFYPLSTTMIDADVQANLWDGDPDIDAVCRMVHPDKVVFRRHDHPFFCPSAVSPFNSQNTFLSAAVIPHYFMHLDVGRWDDIVASYYVQKMGFKVIYGNATVYQERVGHDVMKDFDKELWGYTNWREVIKGNLDILSERAKLAFRAYQRHFE